VILAYPINSHPFFYQSYAWQQCVYSQLDPFN
jgi:hypothetical protein